MTPSQNLIVNQLGSGMSTLWYHTNYCGEEVIQASSHDQNPHIVIIPTININI